MREIFIKYNPYKVETQITIDGNPVKKNSALNFGERRLQEWIEGLPEILVKECNTKEFHILFHGTVLDFEDLQSVAVTAQEKDGIVMTCEHKPAKEVQDKERAIEEIFDEIIHNPYYEELKHPDIQRAFEIARTSEFPVNVVATMSSGKSTLINALLGQKLMPAKQEACTATITELHDSDEDHFHAKVYNSDGLLIQSVDPLTLTEMEALNANPDVFKNVVDGNIPFVDSDDVSLVLVDTPGPNNARDPEHRAATYRMLSESSKTVVLYILNATQLAINDDNDLLTYVANSMKVGGKQSKDRFVFVLNKLDDFKRGEDSVESAIERTRQYLSDKGIEDPNIYPASALTALNIRTVLRDLDMNKLDLDAIDDEQVFEVIAKVKKMNKNPDLHLEEYAPLTPSIRGEITKELAAACEAKDPKREALVHSGIIPIEAAIRMYVQKYAKTAKIKGIVDTFAKKLESQQSFERTQQEIAENQGRRDQILENIESIKNKISDGEKAKSFKSTVEELDFSKEVKSVSSEILKKATTTINDQIRAVEGKKLSRIDAESLCTVFQQKANALQAEIQVKLEKVISDTVKKNGEALMEAYKQRLASFSEDVENMDLTINPMELIGGDISAMMKINDMINSAASTEKVVVGEEWVKNTDKKWWKPWTWFQESGHYKKIYADQEYVDGKKLGDAFFAPIEENLRTNTDAAVKYATEQAKAIKKQFVEKFNELDQQLAKKLKELERCASDQSQVEVIIKQSKERLDWLTEMQKRIQDILDI